MGRFVFRLLVFTLFIECLTPTPALALPSITGVCASIMRSLIGSRGPRAIPTRAEIRARMPKEPGWAKDRLRQLSLKFLKKVKHDKLNADQMKDLVAFIEELPAGLRSGLSPAEIYHLFRQNEALYTGAFRETAPAKSDLETQFLGAFWTPKTEIVGAIEKDGKLVVLTHRGYDVFVRSALPATFHGKPVTVYETDREGSLIDPKWMARNKEEYYAEKPVVLLTGSTSGVGLSIAKQLIAKGYRVVLTGRAASLPALHDAGIVESDRVLIRPLDITRAEDRDRVVAEITERWGGVDALINNASISVRGSVEDSPEANSRRQMEVDYFGPMQLTRQVLPLMRMKGRGRILNLSSILGNVAFPQMADYAAAKHALEGATEALRLEMAPYGVKASLVEPGLTPTPGVEKTIGPGPNGAPLTDPKSPYTKAQNSLLNLVRWMLGQTDATPESVARVVVRQLEKKTPPLRVQTSLDSWGLILGKRLVPQFLMQKILQNQMPDYRNWQQIDPPAINPEGH